MRTRGEGVHKSENLRTSYVYVPQGARSGESGVVRRKGVGPDDGGGGEDDGDGESGTKIEGSKFKPNQIQSTSRCDNLLIHANEIRRHMIMKKFKRALNLTLQGSEQNKPHQSSDIDWDVGMTLVKKAEECFPIERVTDEQMESIATKTVSGTLSKIAAHSTTLQSLVDLGVDISKWERAGLSAR